MPNVQLISLLRETGESDPIFFGLLNQISGLQKYKVKSLVNPEPLYFAMARGYQNGKIDIKAMEMTKWFDTNYHYIVPEFKTNQKFKLIFSKIIDEFLEAKNFGIITRPVILGPLSFLYLGKTVSNKFNKLSFN